MCGVAGIYSTKCRIDKARNLVEETIESHYRRRPDHQAEDGNSMGNSVESRLPFMDYRLVEVALALPDAVKLRGGFGKWILREVARGSISEEIRKAHYKRGSDVRESDWFEQGLGATMHDALRIRLPEIKQLLDPGAKVDKLFSDVQLKYRALVPAEATTLIWLGNNIA